MDFKECTVFLKSSNTIACSKETKQQAHHVLIENEAYHRNQVKGKVKLKYKGSSMTYKCVYTLEYTYLYTQKNYYFCSRVSSTAHMHISHAGDFMYTYVHICVCFLLLNTMT